MNLSLFFFLSFLFCLFFSFISFLFSSFLFLRGGSFLFFLMGIVSLNGFLLCYDTVIISRSDCASCIFIFYFIDSKWLDVFASKENIVYHLFVYFSVFRIHGNLNTN